MAFDVDIIEFTGGDHAGQYGVCIDRKLQTFAVYDHKGNFLNCWTEDDVYEDEAAREQEDYVPSPIMAWINANPFVLWGSDKENCWGLPAFILAAVAKVAADMSAATGQQANCLGDNLLVLQKADVERSSAKNSDEASRGQSVGGVATAELGL